MTGLDVRVSTSLQWTALLSIVGICGFTCPGGIAAQQSFLEESAPQQTQIAIHGRVIDEAGSPMPEVEVSIKHESPQFHYFGHDTTEQDNVLVRTRTDSDGKFRFTNESLPEGYPEHGPQIVFASSPGKGMAWRWLHGPVNGEFTLKLLPEFVFFGEIIDENGLAAEGATVTVLKIETAGVQNSIQMQIPESIIFRGGKVSPRSTTDTEGRFTIHGLPPGKQILFSVQHKGHLTRHFHYVLLEDPDTAAMKIELVRERTVRAKLVYDDTGLPAANVHVYGYPGNYGVTDENGSIDFRQVSGRSFVFNSHQTPLPYTQTFATAEFAEDEFEKEVLMRIAVGGLIHGRLNSADGKPMGLVRIIYFADNPNPLDKVHDFQETITDESGNFKMSVEPGEGTIYAVGQSTSDGLPSLQDVWGVRKSDRDFPGVPHRRVEVHADQPGEVIEWNVPLYRQASGIAVFTNGSPAMGARVRYLSGDVEFRQRPYWRPVEEGHTDSNGRFRMVDIPITPEDKNRLVDHQGVFLFTANGGRFTSFLFPDKNNVYPTRVVLHPAGTIQGAVGAANVKVSIFTSIDGRRVVLPKTKTDKDGKFVFQNLPTGYDYSITYPVDLDIEPAEENTVVIEVNNLEETVELNLNDQ